MMRGFYITGIVLAAILFLFTIYYAEETRHARWRAYDYNYNSYNSYGGYNYSSYSNDKEYTIEAGLISAFFFLFFIALEILTLIKLKTTTMKVLSIIGISITGIMILWDLLMLVDPGGISFNEVSEGWIIFAMIQTAFCIVGTVHAFRKKA